MATDTMLKAISIAALSRILGWVILAALFSGCSKGSNDQSLVERDTTPSSLDSESDSRIDVAIPDSASSGNNTASSSNETETLGPATEPETSTWTETVSDVSSDSITDTGTAGPRDSETADVGKETDSDTENPWLPPGCEYMTHSAENWHGKSSIYDGKMVWGELDPLLGCQTITLRNLATKEHIPIADCDYGMMYIAMFGNYVYWAKQIDGTDEFSRELFRLDIETKEMEQLTNNACAEFGVYGGEDYIVYSSKCEGATVNLKYMNLSTKDAVTIAYDAQGNPSGGDFDGTRWTVWISNDVAYKYDIVNAIGPTPMDSTLGLTTWPEIVYGKVYSGSWELPVDPNKKCDIHVHDLETSENTWAFTSPWDQIGPSVSGHVLAYLDTEELRTLWLSSNYAHVEIFDLDTKVTRRVTNLPEIYYTVTMYGKHLAWGAGDYTIILCDLEAGGFIDKEGHVIPENGPMAVGTAGPDSGSSK